jgi:hypothetical protein
MHVPRRRQAAAESFAAAASPEPEEMGFGEGTLAVAEALRRTAPPVPKVGRGRPRLG